MSVCRAEDLLKIMPEDIVNLANRLRVTIMNHVPDCEEAPIPAAKIIHYLLQPPKYLPGNFVAMAVSPAGVVLHFPHGDQLDDPDHLLEGHGGRLRKLQILNDQDAYHPGIIALIEAAAALRQR